MESLHDSRAWAKSRERDSETPTGFTSVLTTDVLFFVSQVSGQSTRLTRLGLEAGEEKKKRERRGWYRTQARCRYNDNGLFQGVAERRVVGMVGISG